ncbi:MAG: DUF378 domain-containing protein [Cyanobacteria bacterium]|nr:DUF378 domain-containing protein [Cyanobacteriota bacterium]MDA1020547.1 DUF378 domain-containing protein [Cyanobacteriota bacterium]
MHLINLISSLLLVVGALNWGLVGILDINIVEMLFGSFGMVVDLVYGLIGLSSIHYIMQGKLFPVQ